MDSFHECMIEYKKEVQKGTIIKAYRGLMEYFGYLRSHFKKKFPECSVSGSVYQGYMDMTYFAVFPSSLKHRKLKIAIVFLHEAFRFEVWLASVNKSVQAEYWKFFKESNWNKYHIPSNIKGIDSIVEYNLVSKPDFSNMDGLTIEIERGTMKFIKDIEDFLCNH